VNNVLDYDDLLLWWAQMVGEPRSPPRSAGVRHVFVDEYQDTTGCRLDPAG